MYSLVNVGVKIRLPFRNMLFFFLFFQTNATATLKKFVPHCCSVIEHLTSGKLLNSSQVDILSEGLCNTIGLSYPIDRKRN